MQLAFCLAILCLTCVYWMVALFILFLRLYDPRVSAMARYGGRHVADAVADSIVASGTNAACYESYRWGTRRRKEWIQECFSVVVNAFERSFLCRMQVSRKTSFCAFYVTGIVFSFCFLHYDLGFFNVVFWGESFDFAGGCNTFWRHLEALPLCAFFIHCAVRFWECMCFHRFRNGSDDTVTLFAALSGCSFYVFAAVSNNSCVFSFVYRTQTCCRVLQTPNCTRDSCYSFFPAAVVVLMFFFHLLLQGIQVFHHGVLAKLRYGLASSILSSSCSSRAAVLMGKENILDARDREKTVLDPLDSLYKFPYSHLFVYVLEPHYACEIMMYTVNALGIWVLISYDTYWIIGNMWSLKEFSCLLVLTAGYLAPLGVLVFSLINLAVTASEHRLFWTEENKVREKKERIPRWNLFYGVW